MLYAKTEEQTYENEVIISLFESKMEKYIQCNMLCSCILWNKCGNFFNMFSSIAILNALFEIQYLRKRLTISTLKIHCKYQ